MTPTRIMRSSRNRRKYDLAVRPGARRFTKTTKYPLAPMITTKKRLVVQKRIRILGVCAALAVFLILFGAQKSSRGKEVIQFWTKLSSSTFPPEVLMNSSPPAENKEQPPNNMIYLRNPPGAATTLMQLASSPDNGTVSPGMNETITPHVLSASDHSGSTDKLDPGSNSAGDPPTERAELYYREDLVNESRPICRIHGACLQSDGIYSLPEWMRIHRNELGRCGLAVSFQYHNSRDGPPKREYLDIDFVHTHQTTKFRDPPSHFAHFYPEVIMKASFLFEMLSGRVPSDTRTKHCYISETNRDCSSERSPNESTFKPGFFVPGTIKTNPSLWAGEALSLLENAYGHLTQLSLADILNVEHTGKTNELSSTCFRSVITSFPVYRDFPSSSFAEQNRFFKENGIERAPRQGLSESTSSSCPVSVGILDRDGQRAMVDPQGLKESIQHIGHGPTGNVKILVDVFKFDQNVSFEKQIQRMQSTDILIAAHGAALANIGFMRRESVVAEIFPFGWQPSLFKEIARVFGETYHTVPSVPQPEIFGACIENAKQLMIRKGLLQEGNDPGWYQFVMQAWNDAITEHTLSGKETISFVEKNSRLSNFYTRSCARHQTLEFDNVRVARLVAYEALKLCKRGKVDVP